MTGHGVPILPRVDPNAKKAEPQLYLDMPKTNDDLVREEIIKEEDAKEVPTNFLVNDKHDIHDLANAYLPKEDLDKPKEQLRDHDAFFAKKAKYEKKRNNAKKKIKS